MGLVAIHVESEQALEVVEDRPVPDDRPVDWVLGQVNDAAEACFHNLLPSNTVDNLNPIRSLKSLLYTILLFTLLELCQ